MSKLSKKKFSPNISSSIAGLLIFIAWVSIAAIITLNLTFIYPFISRHFELDIVTGLSHEVLLYNYRIMIAYNNWPWISTLYMPDFPMSPTGEFHFWEVRVIFQGLQIITLVFILYFLWNLRRKKSLLRFYNSAANWTLIIFTIFLLIMLIDFGFFFYWFHRAFFNNDYWLFNPSTDPVIRALPYQLFMIKGFIITAILFFISVVIKVRFYMSLRKKMNM